MASKTEVIFNPAVLASIFGAELQSGGMVPSDDCRRSREALNPGTPLPGHLVPGDEGLAQAVRTKYVLHFSGILFPFLSKAPQDAPPGMLSLRMAFHMLPKDMDAYRAALFGNPVLRAAVWAGLPSPGAPPGIRAFMHHLQALIPDAVQGKSGAAAAYRNASNIIQTAFFRAFIAEIQAMQADNEIDNGQLDFLMAHRKLLEGLENTAPGVELHRESHVMAFLQVAGNFLQPGNEDKLSIGESLVPSQSVFDLLMEGTIRKERKSKKTGAF